MQSSADIIALASNPRSRERNDPRESKKTIYQDVMMPIVSPAKPPRALRIVAKSAFLALLIGVCAGSPIQPAQAQLPDEIRTPTPPPTLPDSATRFGTLPGARSVSLSPDGSMIAFLSPSTGLGNDLYVVSTAEGAGRP